MSLRRNHKAKLILAKFTWISGFAWIEFHPSISHLMELDRKWDKLHHDCLLTRKAKFLTQTKIFRKYTTKMKVRLEAEGRYLHNVAKLKFGKMPIQEIRMPNKTESSYISLFQILKFKLIKWKLLVDRITEANLCVKYLMVHM